MPTTIENRKLDMKDFHKADLIIYGIKLPWDKPSDLIRMLGQQAATSTTMTPASTKLTLKKGTGQLPGALSETFVVDSYWQNLTDDLYLGLKRVVREGLKVGIWRFDFNGKRDDPEAPGQFVVPATFAQAYPNGMPDTEAVNNVLHSNITYNVDGESQEGVTKQAELDPAIYKVGLQMYDFAHNTDFGGTADPQLSPMDQYMQARGTTTNTNSSAPKA